MTKSLPATSEPPTARPPARAPEGPAAEPDETLRHGLNIARRTLLRYGARFEDAEDGAQEIGLSFVMRRDAIRRPEAWFYYSAFRRAMGLRAARAGRTLPLEESDLTGELNEAQLDCQRKFLAMGRVCRHLLGCVFIEGLTLRETAALVKCSLKEVFLLKQRCLKSLRVRLSGGPLPGAAS